MEDLKWLEEPKRVEPTTRASALDVKATMQYLEITRQRAAEKEKAEKEKAVQLKESDDNQEANNNDEKETNVVRVRKRPVSEEIKLKKPIEDIDNDDKHNDDDDDNNNSDDKDSHLSSSDSTTAAASI